MLDLLEVHEPVIPSHLRRTRNSPVDLTDIDGTGEEIETWGLIHCHNFSWEKYEDEPVIAAVYSKGYPIFRETHHEE